VPVCAIAGSAPAATPSPAEPGYVVITTTPDPAWFMIGPAEKKFSLLGLGGNGGMRDYPPVSDELFVASFDKPGRYAIKEIDAIATGAPHTGVIAKQNFELEDDRWIQFDIHPGEVVYLGNFIYSDVYRKAWVPGGGYHSLRYALTKRPEDLSLARRLLAAYRPDLVDRLVLPAN
jgi:hypothetical protein